MSVDTSMQLLTDVDCKAKKHIIQHCLQSQTKRINE